MALMYVCTSESNIREPLDRLGGGQGQVLCHKTLELRSLNLNR